MKKSILILCIFSLLSLPLLAQQNVQKNDTPEKAWRALLTAMRSGKSAQVQAVTTENGYQSLIAAISPATGDEPFAASFMNWANAWAQWSLRWGTKQDSRIELRAGPEIKEHGFVFILQNGEWKMDQWTPGD